MSNNSSIIPQADEKLLDILSNIKSSIAEIDDISELLNIKHMASGYEKAWEGYYKATGFGHDQMMLGFEAKIRAQKKMGELLEKMKLHGGDRGNQYTGGKVSEENLGNLGITKNQSYRYQKIADLPDEIIEKTFNEMRVGIKEPSTSNLFKTAHVSYNSGENEWYTPIYIIESARKTMGSIDLDPATSETANKNVKATKIYTAQDDGLTKEWSGNVWMNPPYSHPLIDEFIAKFISQLPNIKQGIILVNNATETKWFQAILCRCVAVCFPKGRISFLDANGNNGSAPLQGQAIIYFGKNKQEFKNNFQDKGIILWTEE